MILLMKLLSPKLGVEGFTPQSYSPAGLILGAP